MTPTEAQLSVQAMIDDLRHIMGTRPHTGWPDMAGAALRHHRPPIDEALLDDDHRVLQEAGYQAFRGLVAGDADEIRKAILEIRRIETSEDATA